MDNNQDTTDITIDSHFLKSKDFKTNYVSGIFGGITARGQLNMSFFVERNVLPKKVTYQVNEDGSLTEVGRKEKSGIIREVQGGLIFDIDTAKNIADWLNAKIKIHEETFNSTK